MPNPEGADSGKEWIEIFNPQNFPIDLKGFVLKSSNNEHFLEDLIVEPKNYTIIGSKSFKFSIKNSNEKILLQSPSGKTLSEVEITKSESDKSISLIKVFKKNKIETNWILSHPTPGEKNPELYEIEGILSEEITIGKFAEIKIDNTRVRLPEYFDIKTLKAYTKKGDKIKALISDIEGILTLSKIKIINEIKKEETSSAFPYFLLLPISLIGFFLIIESSLLHASCCKSVEQTQLL
jgi:hypothetical protein